ncbi:hypothetical protein K437DRAFT_295568 [Tilletiaria anomala UBC 951]|uniref:Uncharacterized protein n=1 Tax=Tilletiaria anomala (strain ATCC 24038 / CBS 436.72 / UBC 951) TaxID=1037660 RepID=A0A066VMU7_TILAU|nr:uncharacterized protein K437DRAFT_295568 [Tilletiaria anomala UBC 951]KDN41613.1 hypothetical protein K437DRAFT_295568 [Tilletiaria anomala UBC 951]
MRWSMTGDGTTNMQEELQDQGDTLLVSVAARSLLALARQLAVPCLFAGDTWRFEQQTLLAGEHWQQRTLPSLLSKVNAELRALEDHWRDARFQQQQQQQQVAQDASSITDALRLIIKASAKYVPPQRIALPSHGINPNGKGNASVNDDTGDNEEGVKDSHDWLAPDLLDSFIGNRQNRTLAQVICDRASILLSSLPVPTNTSESSGSAAYARSLLSTYIKHLYSASPSSSSVDRDTGRAKAPREHLSHSGAANWDVLGTAGGWDNVAWKGGMLSSAAELVLTADIEVTDGDGSADEKAFTLLRHRHDGIGAPNVFAWAVRTVAAPLPTPALDPHQQGCEKEREFWEAAWPLIIPPLLTMLDDSSLHSRIMATRIFYYGLLELPLRKLQLVEPASVGSSASEVPIAPPILLLIRTGLHPLVASSLSASLTYFSDPLSYLALPDTLYAARALALLVTQPEAVQLKVQSGRAGFAARTGKEASKDSRVQRFEEICKLLSEGVLRPWTYISLPRKQAGTHTSSATRAVAEEEGSPHEQQGFDAKPVSSSNLLMLALLRSATQLFMDAGPAGCARYLDVSIEFLCALLLEREPVARHKNDREHSGKRQSDAESSTSVAEVLLAYETVRVILAIVETCTAHLFPAPDDTASRPALEEEREDKEIGQDTEPIAPIPLLPPNLEDRASDVVFAASMAWVKFGLFDEQQDEKKEELASSCLMNAEIRHSAALVILTHALKRLVNQLLRAMPTLETKFAKGIVTLDDRMAGLFAHQ